MTTTRARLISWTVELKPISRRRPRGTDPLTLESPPDAIDSLYLSDEESEGDRLSADDAKVESKPFARYR